MKRIILLALIFACAPAWADCDFKADTSVTYLLGPLLDSTDGITAETVTVAQADVRLWKEGGTTFAQKNDATSCTQRENGYQTCPLNTTDTNTEGTLMIATDDSVGGVAIVPVFEKCNVLGADEYDRKYGALAQLTSTDTGLRLSTTVGTATTQVELILDAGDSNNDAYPIGAPVLIQGGGEGCESEVADYVGSSNTLTIGEACPFTVAAADVVRIFVGLSATAQDNLALITGADGANIATGGIDSTAFVNAAIDEDALAPTAVAEIQAGVATELSIQSGTADSGSITTLVDAALTEADTNYWAKNIALVITSGSSSGQVVCVTSFTPGTDTLTFTPPTTQAISTNTYNMIAAPGCDPFR